MKKVLLSVLAVAALFVVATPAEAKVTIKTGGTSSNVFISQSIATSSANTVTTTCSSSYTITSNGGGTNTVTTSCVCK